MDLVLPGLVVGDHLINGAPVGEAAEVAIVDEDVGFELAGEVLVVAGIFFGVVAVDGPELDAAVAAPLDGFVQEVALADAPEDELVVVTDQHLQCLDGEGFFFAYGGVTMFYDRSVEVDGDDHFLMELSSFLP